MSDEVKHEIVIIRRGGHGEHEAHHGGVWKIAFADFMTAMMAFFLVMWLISANDKTRASVARYFNPVRLVDATTQPRGLHDSKKDESGITASLDGKKPDASKGEPQKASAPEAPAPGAGPESPAQRDKRLDGALRENPLVALAEIAATKGPGDTAKDTIQPTPATIGRRGGAAFRDPFAPPPPPAPGSAPVDDEAIEPETTVADAGPQADSAGGGAQETTRQDAAADTPKDAAKRKAEAKAILAALRPAGADAPGPGLDVRVTDEGLVLSLTDTAVFSMFANGSAVPDKRVIAMMEKVAHVVQAKPGTVVVRGYTDNKPFRSGRYDNWHLSLDRAQVAHYMLVRGGLADARIGHVEGYADKGARAGTDPASPLNRRIEILLKAAKA